MSCGVACSRFALGLAGGIKDVVSYFGVEKVYVGFGESGKIALPFFQLHEDVCCMFEYIVGWDAVEVCCQDAEKGLFGCSDAVTNP